MCEKKKPIERESSAFELTKKKKKKKRGPKREAMEGVLSSTDKQSMVSSFLEIAVGQTADTAKQFLQVMIFFFFFNFFYI